MGDFLLGTGYFMLIFIVMTVVCNFIFLFLSWEFLGLESERGCSVCWPSNKITRRIARAFARLVLKILKIACRYIFT